MERHFANAQKVAEFLDARDDVLWWPTPACPAARTTSWR